MLATVLHPAFVDSLAKRRLLRRDKNGRLSMPGAGGIRLPIVKRGVSTYENCIEDVGFGVEAEEIHATPALLSAKPGLKEAGQAPLALILDCRK
jgi:hypothetical protein